MVTLHSLFAIVVFVMSAGYAFSAWARLWADSVTRRREAVEGFYEHAKAVYDIAADDVPEEIGRFVLELEKTGLEDRTFVRRMTSALPAKREEGACRSEAFSSALKQLTPQQIDHLCNAAIHAALASAELRFVAGRTHRRLLEYALRHGGDTQHATACVEAIAENSRYSHPESNRLAPA